MPISAKAMALDPPGTPPPPPPLRIILEEEPAAAFDVAADASSLLVVGRTILLSVLLQLTLEFDPYELLLALTDESAYETVFDFDDLVVFFSLSK